MKYIIYGAGADGRVAFGDFGLRVAYFCDQGKAGESIEGRYILTFSEMEDKYRSGNFIIVIASTKYQTEMELKLVVHGIRRYFVYNKNWYQTVLNYFPAYTLYGKRQYMSYTDVLMHNSITSYHHIAVGNINAALPLLMAEIAFQCNDWKVDYIISEHTSIDNSFMGVPIVSIDKIKGKIDCLVINERRDKTDLRDKLSDNLDVKVIDLYDIMGIIPAFHHPELARFKDVHKGKRCFIIGNGPSLRLNDLEKLHKHNEICFGVNGIGKCFSLTDWRPTYYCISDTYARLIFEKYIDYNKCETFYSDVVHFTDYDGKVLHRGNVVHYEFENYGYGKSLPGFSDDITKGVYDGKVVIYELCLQIAAYMGFKEIYLLGNDCSYFVNESQEKKTHFLNNYISDEELQKIKKSFPKRNNPTDFITWVKWIMQAYQKAENYSRTHNFRIYNATRGGELEVFERKDFDSLFDN